MDKILKQSLLYDFYGELLTSNQKNIYEQYLVEDLSISEIATNQKVSRQGVHDTIKRCESILEEYERKLQLVKRFISIKDKVGCIEDLLDKYNAFEATGENEANKKTDGSKSIIVNEDDGVRELMDQIRRLSHKIIEEL